MRKISLVLAGIAGIVLGSLAVVACVGDDPPAGPTGSGTRGMLDSLCFENGTCNPGLSCNVVQGAAKCVPAGDAAVANDASSVTDAGTQPIADAAPSVCVFKPTAYPCPVGTPPMACYGTSSSCTATGCINAGEQQWGCFSQRQCNDVNPCCVPTTSGTLEAGVACAQGTLGMSPEAGTGSICSNSLSCGAGETRLCQADSHCPAGERCVPIKVTGGPSGLDGKVYLGACVP